MYVWFRLLWAVYESEPHTFEIGATHMEYFLIVLR
jgi:hypothetical protein